MIKETLDLQTVKEINRLEAEYMANEAHKEGEDFQAMRNRIAHEDKYIAFVDQFILGGRY